jgi:hypothetical protein
MNETIDILDTDTFTNKIPHGRLKDCTTVFLDCCILHFCYRVTGQTSFKGMRSEFEEVSATFFSVQNSRVTF